MGDNNALQDVIGDGSQEQDRAVTSRWNGGEMVLAHPTRDKGEEREPEKQVQIRPHDGAVDGVDRFEQVMMIIPIDSQVNKAEHVA